MPIWASVVPAPCKAALPRRVLVNNVSDRPFTEHLGFSRQMPDEVIAQQAQMLANRVVKNLKHLQGRMRKAKIGAFRLYDRDIPEIRAAVDWYEGHLLLHEYVRDQVPPHWLPAVAEVLGQRLQIPSARLHLRKRTTGDQRYERLGEQGERVAISEGDVEFLCNLTDYQDTGLFPDHRLTRQWVRKQAQGKDLLNLFAYTGSFSLQAAKGGAASTTSVDLSSTYLDWARDNFAHNGLLAPEHRFIRSDVSQFLARTAQGRERWGVIVLDPPSRSTSTAMRQVFDIQSDHRQLIEMCLPLLLPGGTLWFSTNHQRFEPALQGLAVAECVEKTVLSVPEDYRNRTVHRLWQLTMPA